MDKKNIQDLIDNIEALDEDSPISDVRDILEQLNDLKADIVHEHSESDIADLDRMRYRGNWNKDDDYEANDVVVYGESIHICCANNTNIKPGADSTYWEALTSAIRGKDGRDGKDGKDGKSIKGKDGRDGKDGKDGKDIKGKDGQDGKAGQGFNWRGRWVKDTVYAPYDVVEFYGSSYVALRENSNIPILSDEDWDLMASAGTPGGTGAPGPQGSTPDIMTLVAKMAFGETPTPSPNGVETVFYTPNPYISGTLKVWRGSLRMYPTLDVIETDPDTGKFTLNVAPNTNEPLLVEYIKP